MVPSDAQYSICFEMYTPAEWSLHREATPSPNSTHPEELSTPWAFSAARVQFLEISISNQGLKIALVVNENLPPRLGQLCVGLGIDQTLQGLILI